MRATRGHAFERLHRLIDQGELVIQRLFRVPDQRQGQAQHGVGSGGRGALHQTVTQSGSAAHLSPGMKCQGLHTGAQGRGHRVHRCRTRLPLAHQV